jgi:DNA-binding NarL/FixJ family response regulator
VSRATAADFTNMRSGKIHVLVADDHVTVLEGVAAIIGRQKDMVVVAQAANGRDAVNLWDKHRPDVTLIDLRMPILDGPAAIYEIRRLDPLARIIVLTTFHTDADIASALKAGAKGYLMKDAPRENLLEAIRDVHAGQTYIPASLAANLAASIANEPLTGRELQVLALLAQGKSNKEIGANLYIGETTVKSHLRSIFTKLNVLSRTEAIATATRRGLVQL